MVEGVSNARPCIRPLASKPSFNMDMLFSPIADNS